MIEALDARVLFSAGSVIAGTVRGDWDSGAVLDNEVVFLDANNNGVLDSGEPQTATDANGGFRFVDVGNGSYVLRWAGTPGIGAAGRHISNAGAAAGYAIDITGADQITGQDFLVAPDANTIYGFVFIDTNIDQAYQPGERVFGGGSVTCTSNIDPVSGRQQYITGHADGSGYYWFSNLAPGTYTVSISPWGGSDAWQFPEYNPRATKTVVVPATTPATAAGVRADLMLNGEGGEDVTHIEGTLFTDVNENGVQDAGDGLGGGYAYVDINHNGKIDGGDPSSFADATGHYSIPLKYPGTFTVSSSFPRQWLTTTSTTSATFTLLPGQTATGPAFGAHYQPPDCTISGVVYDDANHNGVKDTGETGIGGVFVFVDLDRDGTASSNDDPCYTTTAADGSYTIGSLSRGTVSLGYIRPQYWHATTPTADSFFSDVTFDARGQTKTVDLGTYFYQPTGVITGTIYLDRNQNRKLDASDQTGTQSVFADLNNNGRPDGGEPLAPTVSGQYSIGSLPTGDVVLRVCSGANAYNTAITVHAIDGQTVTAENLLYASALGCGAYTDECSISGTLFNDLNADGIREDGEPGLGGMKVYVREDPFSSSGKVVADAVTEADGSFEFEQLNYGNHQLQLDVPGGWNVTSPRNGAMSWPYTDRGQKTTGVLLGMTQASLSLGDVTGTVFNDLNRNGLKDDGEDLTPLGAQSVYLDENGNGVRDRNEPAALLDGANKYQFTGLLAGDYQIVPENPSAGYWELSPPAGGWTVYVPANGTSVADRGIAPAGLVGGVVFDDQNGDGVQDVSASTNLSATAHPMALTAATAPLEPGVAGRTVYLDLNGNGVRDGGEPAAVTNASGKYTLYGVNAGRYTVRQVVPAGWSQTYPSANAGIGVKIGWGIWATGKAFGTRLPPAPPPPPAIPAGTVTGSVFNDLNGNGARDAGEPGLAGRKVWLDKDKDGVVDAAEKYVLTNAGGNFTFTGLAKGSTWRVAEVLGSGFRRTGVTYKDLTLGSVGVGGVLFAETKTAQIAGTVFNDANGNKTKQSTEAGLVGWRLFLDTDNDGVWDSTEASAVTDAAGAFTFKGLAAGTYTMRLVLPSGWKRITPATGYLKLTVAAAKVVTGQLFGVKKG